MTCRVAGLVVLLAALPVAAVRVDQVPRPAGQHNWVSDGAGVISSAEEQAINAVADQLERDTGAEVVVVTVSRVDGVADAKEFATELFNTWKLGKQGVDNGVLVLLDMGSRRIEIETGYGVEAMLPDSRVGGILDSNVIPEFKAKRFGAGLVAGVEAIDRALRQSPPVAGSSSGGAAAVLVSGGADPRSGGALGWLWALLGLGVVGGGGVVAARRASVRPCPDGHGPMRFLPESEDDRFLNAMQILEEQLGGTDYRVWQCDECGKLHLERKKKIFTSTEDCPQCGNRTVRVDSRTLRAPSYYSAGLREVTRRCQAPNCTYHDLDTQVIPQLQHTTSSSSGFNSSFSSGGSSFGGGGGGRSFGGGSSGGGGAGRSF